MLFNSFVFIFVFLPICFVAFATLRRYSASAALFSLFISSVIFYAWWFPPYLFLLAGSIIFNFYLGRILAYRFGKKYWLIFGVSVNLLILAWFKYVTFFADSFVRIGFIESHTLEILLPIGISFFTFQQITYLVEIYKGRAAELSWLRYSVFVSFFPQLIAGPIVSHKILGPQLSSFQASKGLSVLSRREKLLVLGGLTLFIIGLAKKTLIADNLSPFVAPVFDVPLANLSPDFVTAWGAVLAYTFQIYFDFSGYSDMAVGLGCMFGFRLPVNFLSPYKASSPIDFWRRWHITLSNFLRDYLYLPMGGALHNNILQPLSILITMLLGLWHKLNWTFVIWGAWHGLILAANHLFRRVLNNRHPIRIPSFLCVPATFLLIIVGWVMFRSPSFSHAMIILKSMLVFTNILIPERVYSLVPVLYEFSWFSVGGNPLDILLNIFWIVLAGGIAPGCPHGFLFYPLFEERSQGRLPLTERFFLFRSRLENKYQMVSYGRRSCWCHRH